MRGGAYFFLPGLRALRYIAGAPSTQPIRVSAGPTPAVGFWTPVLLFLHRGLQSGMHFERRLEPFFRRGLNRIAPASPSVGNFNLRTRNIPYQPRQRGA